MTVRPSKTAVCAAVLALAPLPLLLSLPREYAGRADYAFVLVAVPAAGFFARGRLRRARPYWAGHRRVGRLFVLVAAVALLAAALFASPWGAGVALLLVLAALAWEFGGWAALGAVIPSLVIGAVGLPLPFNFDRTFSAAVGRAAARWSSHLLDMLRVAHVRSEQVIAYPGGRLDFGDLIGGWFSPFALGALLLSVAVVFRRGFVRTLILTASGLAFLTFVTAATETVRLAWFGGSGPDAAWEAVAFLLSAALGLSVDQWADIPAAIALRRHDLPPEAVPTVPVGPATWAGAVGPFAATVFVGLAGLQIWAVAAPASQMPAGLERWLPDKTGDWVIAGSPESAPAGALAAVHYQKGGRRLDVAVIPAVAQGPVSDLEEAGWIRQGGTTPDAFDPALVRTGWEFPAEKFAMVWVCGLAANGQKAPPPLSGTLPRVTTTLARTLRAEELPARWWLRAVLVTTIPPGTQDLDEAAAAVRQLCGDISGRLKGGPGR